jgi:hypothetical protein
VLCSSSAIDRDENKLSLFNVLEQITLLEPITEPGIMPLQAHLVTLWSRENLRQEVKTTARIRLLVPPNGEQVGKTQEYAIDLTKHPRLRQRLVFRTLPVRTEGLDEFVIEYLNVDDQWQEATRVPLDLVVKVPPAASPDAKGEAPKLH